MWADLDQAAPDGICLDGRGAAWFADVGARHRVVTDTVEFDRGCFSRALGGPGRRTLFVVAADRRGVASATSERTGQVRATGVEVPAA